MFYVVNIIMIETNEKRKKTPHAQRAESVLEWHFFILNF